MIRRILQYPGYIAEFSAEPSSTRRKDVACLYFHGFPAIRHVKNIDLAEATAHQAKMDSFVLHYRGLGESLGRFGFYDSVVEGTTVAHFILKEFNYSKLILIGHSWGGMVATNVACELKSQISQLILLSPLVRMKVGDALYAELRAVQKDIPHLFAGQSDDDIRADFQKALDHFMLWNRVKDLPKDLRVDLIQSAFDDSTPAEIAKQLPAQTTTTKIHYQELPLDHSFAEDRPLLIKTLLAAMNQAH